MSPISNKKCAICNSTFPNKVIFCSVCGTELVEEVKKPTDTFDSPIDLPSGHPNSKPFLRDEPLDTKPIDGGFIVDKTQYAWQVSENIVPLKMKGEISYSEGFRSPKLNVKRFKQLSFFESILLGGLNTLISVSLLFFSSIILLVTLNLIPSNWLSIFLATFIALVYSGLSYLSCFKTAQVLSNWDEKPLKMSKSNFFSFSLIQAIQVGLISTISVICLKLFFPHSEPISSPISMYVPSIIIILLVAFLSPTFRIAKILTLIRSAGVFQDFLDAFQFPKIGARRTVEVIAFSYILPASLIIATFSPTSHVVSTLLTTTIEINVAAWEYVLVGIVILVLAASITFANFVDVNTFYFYEQSIQSYIEPPSLNWVKRIGNPSNSDDKESSGNYNRDTTDSLESRDERCPVCSSILVTGAEFCTDCGKKVVK